MIPDDILAVIVSYNGLGKTVDATRALLDQVGHVHIVDNGSEPDSLACLDALEALPRVSIQRLGRNHGIGHALNLAVVAARNQGRRWILTMDQDSLPDPGMVRAFGRALEAHPDLACLAPSVLLRGLGGQIQEDGPLPYAITSGNLVRMDVFDQCGAYNEEMFIDAVDFDFSLRVRRSGRGIWRVGDAILHHELGAPHRVPKPFARFYTAHSPTRRYYMYRNFLYLAQRHGRHFPLFVCKSAVAHVLLLILIPFYDKAPGQSLAAVWQGIRDFFLGRMGPRPEPEAGASLDRSA